MKLLIPLLLLGSSLLFAGCNQGAGAGDVNVGVNTAPQPSSTGTRPGTPGASESRLSRP